MPLRFVMKRLVFPLILAAAFLCLTAFTASVQLGAGNQLELKANTKYRISGKIDLGGKTLQIPEACTLVFRGGSISNGSLVFNSTVIKGHPRFENCQFKGKIKIRKIDDRDFTSKDEKGTFVFLFSNAVTNGVKCDFHRDYRISMKGVNSSGLMQFENLKSGADIRFHDCSIYNTYVFPTLSIKPVIVLTNVKNIFIRNCSFYDVKEHNTHLFAESNGANFIQCYGDCERINLVNCYQENGDCFLRSGVYKHYPESPNNTPSVGLENSTLNVRSKNTGYGLALYCGNNLKIDLDVDSPHRGLYCAGVSNSTIKYRGFRPVETKCHVLLKDAVYKKMDSAGKYSLDMKGCSNLSISVVIDKLMTGERVVIFSTYGSGKNENADFSFRSEPCQHSKIDIAADIRQYPDDGYNYIVSVNSDGDESNGKDVYGCKVTEVKVHGMTSKGGKANRNLCMVQAGTFSQIEFSNCKVSDQEPGYNIQVFGNAKGEITIKDCNLENVYVRNKLSDELVVNAKKAFVKGGLVYIKDQASREGLVRLIKSDK